MTTLADIERELPMLSAGEKAQLLQWIARDLGQSLPGIESTPGVCGGEPCIVRTRIPVWVLERARQLGSSEAELLRAYPTLRAQDIVNAWAYVDMHREEIEQQIREEDTPEDDARESDILPKEKNNVESASNSQANQHRPARVRRQAVYPRTSHLGVVDPGLAGERVELRRDPGELPGDRH